MLFWGKCSSFKLVMAIFFSNVCMKLKTHSHVLRDGMEVLKFLHVHISIFISSCMNLTNECLKGILNMNRNDLRDACALIHLVGKGSIKWSNGRRVPL